MLHRASLRIVRKAFCEPLESRLLLAAGDLDTTFSGDGKATIALTPDARLQASDVAVQSGGRVIVVGESFNGELQGKLVVARYRADGSLDTSFGGPKYPGIAFTEFSDIITNPNYQGIITRVVAVQPADDKIVVVGWALVGLGSDMVVVRFTPDGALDTSFSGDGRDFITDFDGNNLGATGFDVVIQNDGKIVVAGGAQENSASQESDMAVARYNTDGTLDNSFAGNGKQIIGFGQNESAIGMALDYTASATNPKIVLVGSQFPSTNANDRKLAVARLNSNGSLDTSFSGDGRYAAQFGAGSTFSSAGAVVVQPDGKMVIAGEIGLADFATHNFGITRLNLNGTLDTTFGPSGNGLVDIDFSGGSDLAQDIIIGQSGKLIVGGAGGRQMNFACLSSGGILDPIFSGDGKQSIPFGFPANQGSSSASGLALAPGGTIVAAGGTNFATARLFDRKPATVSIGSFEPNATERPLTDPDPAFFIVGRLERLPEVTHVFLNTSGTARPPNTFPIRPRDYNGSTEAPAVISFGDGVTGSTYVDIPPDVTFIIVMITPVDDTTAEGNETATFSIANNILYDIGTPGSTTLTIADNDGDPVAPTVSNVTINGGAVQRSNLTTTVLQFSEPMNLPALIAAGTIDNHIKLYNKASPATPLPWLNEARFAWETGTNRLSIDLTTDGPGGSNLTNLANGRYEFRLNTAGITDSAGNALNDNDGTADGQLVVDRSTGSTAQGLYRLFGDVNGDGIVNLNDLGTLATYFDTNDPLGDCDGDGDTDLNDLGALASSFGTELPAEVRVVAALSPSRRLIRGLLD